MKVTIVLVLSGPYCPIYSWSQSPPGKQRLNAIPFLSTDAFGVYHHLSKTVSKGRD